MNEKNCSKSQRIRDFLINNPGIRNRDVVSALNQFGVTPADVSNAKTHLKKLASKGKVQVEPAAPIPRAEGPTETSVTAGALSEIEATLAFVRQVGSIDRARQLLAIFEQIHQLP